MLRQLTAKNHNIETDESEQTVFVHIFLSQHKDFLPYAHLSMSKTTTEIGSCRTFVLNYNTLARRSKFYCVRSINVPFFKQIK